jgi:hypothetical protein
LPHIQGSLGASVQEVTWVSTGYSVALVLLMPLTAFLGRVFTFRLYESKPKADAAVFRLNTPCVSYLRSSVQGLERGSSVQIFGVQIGAVSDVKLVFDSATRRFVARVEFDLQPERVLKPSEYYDVSGPGVRALVADGLRVVLDSTFLLNLRSRNLQATRRRSAVVASSSTCGLPTPEPRRW